MTKNFIILIVISIPFLGLAQGFSLEDLPEPITEVVDTFSKVRIDVGDGSSFFEKVKGVVSTPSGIFSFIQRVWDTINSWLEQNVGISFREIVRAIGGLFVWALELIIKVIRWGVNLV